VLAVLAAGMSLAIAKDPPVRLAPPQPGLAAT